MRIAAILAVLATLIGPAMAADHPAGDDPRPAQQATIGGPFVLRDHLGRVVYDQDLRGKFMLVYFGYTFCPDVCPTTLQTLSQALDLLGPQADQVWPLFVTVDPERDTVKVLHDYVLAFDSRIIGLTGPVPYVESVIQKYRIKVAKVATEGVPGGYTMDHTSSIILMDPYGEYVRRFPHGTPPEDIAADLKERFGAAR